MIGKKPAAPGDFEVYENRPAQAFTAGGEHIGNRTSRVKSIGHWVHPYQNIRPIPSARRGRTSPLISDLTNGSPVKPYIHQDSNHANANEYAHYDLIIDTKLLMPGMVISSVLPTANPWPMTCKCYEMR